MAILHQATLVPSKLELMSSWLPTQSWLQDADTSPFTALGSYRFDDPEGEVGMEAHLLGTGDGRTIQVPLTYRAAPLSDAESYLVGTTQHSVLGKRWVYDGCGDLVFLQALAYTILNGGHEAFLDVLTDDGLVRREATTKVTGSGSEDMNIHVSAPVTSENRGLQTVVTTPQVEFIIYRVIEDGGGDGPSFTLNGTWEGHSEPALLASLHKR